MNHLVLLDTNIFSFIFKQDSRALLYEPYLQGRLLALSMMTVAKLFQWVAIRHWGESSRVVQQVYRGPPLLRTDWCGNKHLPTLPG